MKFSFTSNGSPLHLSAEQRDHLDLLYLAKHANSGGRFDAADGSHAVYHHEIYSILRELGLRVRAANSFSALYGPPDFNYLFSLFNRAGFRNSEMMASLFGEQHGIPYLGCRPVLRGVADDKHLTKILFRDLGLPTPRWHLFQTSDTEIERPDFTDGRLIAKPNASSASWGICTDPDWPVMKAHIEGLLSLGWDVIVEEFIPGFDITTPVIGADVAWMLPSTRLVTTNPDNVPTYEEKRGFKDGYECSIFAAQDDIPEIAAYTESIAGAFWPFDYGRVDYRIEAETGKLYCIELNISCNLGSQKAIAQGAFKVGLTHSQLVETILCHSLLRQERLVKIPASIPA